MKKTPKEEYRRVINDNHELLSMIWKEMLNQMPKKRVNWGDVEIINYSHETLVKLLVWLRNAESEEEMQKQIETELKEARER